MPATPSPATTLSRGRKLCREPKLCAGFFLQDGKFQDNFKIVKQDPREFWSRVFQKRVIVSWDEFMENFSVVHATRTHEERLALKKTIDILENNYVSWFEFDIFTRLFQPWAQIINNWNVIVVRHTAYCAFMTYDEVQAILGKHTNKPGSYVFRLSCTRLGQWAIGFVTQKNTIVQTIPQSKSLYQALIDGAQEGWYVGARTALGTPCPCVPGRTTVHARVVPCVLRPPLVMLALLV